MNIWNKTRNEPTTHALVIGIGYFPYCGVNSTVPGARRIKNLSSPAYTAYSVANSLITNAERFHAKLGSVTLLTEDLNQNGWTPTLPSFDNVRSAFREWQDKAGAKDCLFLYWCGHGFEYERHQLLMCRDAGKDGYFWDYVLDISDDFHKAQGSKSKTQLWCIDACRDAAEDLKLFGPKGNSVLRDITKSAIKHAAKKDLSLLNATGAFAQANGLVNQPSYFSKAFVDALDWASWRRINQQWQVRTTDFVQPINDLLYEREIDTRCRSLNAIGQHPILASNDGPLIPSSFLCAPTNLQAQTTLSLLNGNRDTVSAQDIPSNGAWKEKVSGGHFYLQGKNVNDNRSNESSVWIQPSDRVGVLRWPD